MIPAPPTPVLIESPFTGPNPELRALYLRYGRACMHDSLMLNEAPFASHLLYTQPGVLDDDVPDERARGIEAGLVWGKLSMRTIVYYDFGISGGMKLGIQRAADEGRPIWFRSFVRGSRKRALTVLVLNAERTRKDVLLPIDVPEMPDDIRSPNAGRVIVAMGWF